MGDQSQHQFATQGTDNQAIEGLQQLTGHLFFNTGLKILAEWFTTVIQDTWEAHFGILIPM